MIMDKVCSQAITPLQKNVLKTLHFSFCFIKETVFHLILRGS